MKRSTLWARLAYISVIGFATLAEPTLSTAGALGRLENALAPAVRGQDLVDAVRNIVLFVGWGAVWTITSSPGGRAWPTILRATTAGLAASLGAEAFQLFSPSRAPSILDVFTNTSGAFCGALVTVVLVLVLRSWRGRKSYVGIPMLLFAAGYGFAAFAEAWSPLFRQDRIPGLWGDPLSRLQAALQNVAGPGEIPFGSLDVLLFIPAGVFAVAALAESGYSYRVSAGIAGLAGILLAGLAEVSHGAAGSWIAIGPMVAHMAGIVIGSLLAMPLIPAFTRHVRGAERPLILLLVYAFVLAFWYLRPFSIELDAAAIGAKVHARNFVPLLAYRERVDVFSAVDALVPAFQLVPVGGLLAVWPVRRQGVWSGIAPGVLVVTLFEALQIIVAGRYFDITDALIGAAALGLGFAIVRRAGYRPYGELASVVSSGAEPPVP
jgi:VanZ family protein